MRKGFCIFLLFVMLGMPSHQASYAALIPLDGIIFDDTNNVYWISNMAQFTNQTYAQQIAGIAALNSDSDYSSPAWGSWQLATPAQIASLFTYSDQEIMDAFDPSYIQHQNIGSDYNENFVYSYWGRFESIPSAGNHGVAGISFYNYVNESNPDVIQRSMTGYISDTATYIHGAWVAAAAAPTNAVPEPSTILLFGIGLACLAGTGLRRK